jgi:hypothetical protein
MKQLSLLDQSRREHPGKSDEFQVVQIAGRILREVGARPPVSLELVGSWCGVHKIDEADLSCAGCLVPLGERLIVQVRQGDSRGRQRFTGFHEIGHTFFPGFSRKTQYRCDPPITHHSPSDIETMCDLAAGELLFPREQFARDLTDKPFGLDTVEFLASDYDASIEATANRLAALWPEETLLLVLEPGRRKGETDIDANPARLRVKYARPSGDWPFVPSNKSAPDDSPLVRAFEGELVSEATALEGLGCPDVPSLEISAKRYSYWRDSKKHDRVLAIYRKRSHSQRSSGVR